MWAHVVAAATGVALMASPAVLDYSGHAATSSWIVGPLAASVGYMAAFEITRALRLLELPLGLWLIATPFVFAAPRDAVAVSLCAGALLVATSSVAGQRKRPYGGGWRSLNG